MAIYLGSITIRNRYVNFKPLYEYQNGKFQFLNQYDRQALLPESSFGDINFYCEDSRQRVDEMFLSDTYCLLEFEMEDLEPNFASNGLRNQTGYKIEIGKLESGKIRYLSDIEHYYVLSESGFEEATEQINISCYRSVCLCRIRGSPSSYGREEHSNWTF